MSKVRITRDNIQQYIDSGQIDPSKVQIDLNKTKTANDNVERWVTLQSAIDSGYDFDFNYELKEPKKRQETVKVEVAQPEDLPELEVVAPKKKPSYNFSTLFDPITNRIKVQTKHPYATDLAGSSLSTLGEFVDVNLPGVSKITSPSWWLGNIGQGYIENPFDYNIRNNGLFEFAPLQKYANEWYAPWINLGFDLGTGYGAFRFNRYLHTPIELGSGAEMQRVYTYPFSKYVYKEGFLPEVKRLQVGRNAPLRQIGTTPEGVPILKQRKLSRANDINFEQMKKLLKRQNFYEMKFPGDTETVFWNPYTDEVALDLIGNYGMSNNGLSMFYDPPQVLLRPEYLATLKRGGKLIPKANNGIQVKIKLPDGKTTDKTYQVGSFLRLKGENFYRRVNSNGTLTQRPNKVLKTLKLNNGVLTLEKDALGKEQWYRNGELVTENYQVYDKTNNTLFKSDSNGNLNPIEINGKKVRKSPSSAHSSIISYNNYYTDKSENLPDSPFKIFIKGLEEQRERYNNEENYFVPLGIPGVPNANVTTGERFWGVTIPYNLLDSVKKYVKDVPGITLEDALGLLGETSAGQAPVATIMKPAGIRVYQEFPDYMQYKNDGKGSSKLGYYPTDVMNNHHYYQNNPYFSYINTLIRQGKIYGDIDIYGPISVYNDPISVHNDSNLNQELINNAAYWFPRLEQQKNTSDNPWINAFEYLRDHNYGMGVSYRSFNRSLGEELLKDPEIQKWYKQSK